LWALWPHVIAHETRHNLLFVTKACEAALQLAKAFGGRRYMEITVVLPMITGDGVPFTNVSGRVRKPE
jgi:hypothetical protein